MRRSLRLWLLLACVALFAFPIPAFAADLSEAEAQLLPVMNQPEVQQALAFVAKVAAWKQRFEELKAKLESIGPDKPLPPEVAALIKSLKQEVIAELNRLAQPVRDKIAQIKQTVDRLQQELAQLQAQAADAQAQLEAYKAQLEQMKSEVEAIAKTLQNPMDFAKSYVEQELLGKYVEKPMTSGDFTFRIKKVDKSVSIFSPQAKIEVSVEYQEGIAVTATGIYFDYSGGLPKPKFDKATIDTNAASVLSGVAAKALGKGLDSIPDLGLPIKLKNVTINPFNGEKPGAIKFDIEIGGLLDFAEAFKIEGKGFMLEPNGKLTVATGLKFTNTTLKIPIGTTPLIMDGYGVTVETKTKTIELETFFATAAGGAETVAMQVSCSFNLPFDPKQGILFKGSLVVGGRNGTKLGDIEVRITKDKVTGKLRIPSEGSPIPKEILNARFDFKLDKEGFTADGFAKMFGMVEQNVDLALRFNGTGHLRTTESLKIAGVNVESSLNVELRNKFQEIELDAVLNVDVDLPAIEASAAVTIHAKWPNGGIDVVAEVAGIDPVSFSVGSIADITPQKIAKELMKHLDDIFLNMAKAAERWAEGKMELLAKWDEHWRDTIHHEAAKYGLDALRTGNDKFDAALGDIARDGKALGAWGSGVYQKSNAETIKFITDPAESLSKLPSNAGRELIDAGGKLIKGIGGGLKIPGGGGGGIKIPGFGYLPRYGESFVYYYDVDPENAAKTHLKAEDRLKAFVAALATVRVQKRSGGAPQGAGQRFASNAAGLDLNFNNGVGASEGEGNASAGLSVFAGGYQSEIRIGADSKATRRTATDVKAAWVEFRPLLSDEKTGKQPKAKIFVDPLKDVSGFNPTMIARYELQRLLETYLPEVEIDGPRFLEEKYFAVKNGTSEPITVWVQAEAEVRSPRGKNWLWRPVAANQTVAEKIVLQPGERKLVPRADAPAGDAIVRGRAVRVWAQSESGEKFTEYRHKDLDLVPPNAQQKNRRVYFGDKLEEYTYEIKPTPGPRDYAQRRVQLKNGTNGALKVTLRYRAEEDGQARWIDVPEFTIPAGQTLAPRDAAGMQVVASRMTLQAVGDERRYVRHEREPMWLVEESPAGRLYRADKVGSYLYEFKQLGADASPREATITANSAQVKQGEATIANVQRGQKFKVEDQSGAWLKVRVTVGGREQVGWIRQDQVQLTGDAGVQAAPAQIRRTVTIRNDNAPLMQGTATIATLRRGEQYPVHGENGGWLRIEIERNGRTLHGWVETRNVDVR